MKIKRWIILFSLLLLTGLGCKGLSKEQQSAIKPITLQYWTVFDDVDTLQQFAAEYHQLRPYVTIQIRQVRYEEFDKLFVNALADQVGPDIISSHVRWLKNYQTRLAPLPASVKVARIEVKGQYSPETIVTIENMAMPSLVDVQRNYVGTVADDVAFGGQMYGLPLALDTLALFYNKELLDRAGVAIAPTTWSEFTEAVKKTTKLDKDSKIVQSGVALGTGANIDNAPDLFALFTMQNGIPFLVGNRVAFADGLDRNPTTHPALEALRFYTDFARPTKDVYSWNDTRGNALESFAQGKTAFYFGFAFDRPRLFARGPQLAYEIIPVPQLNTPGSNVANYWVESVSKQSKHQDEAWDFIRFISSPDHIKAYTTAVAAPSPLRAHIAEQLKDPKLAPFVSQILTAKNWYRGQDVDAAGSAIRNAINQSLAPLPADKTQNTRDTESLIFAAQVIQQTL